MKKLYFFLLILIPLLAFGATIQWFHQQPATTTLANTDIFALETTPAAYRYITVANMKSVFQGLPGAPAVNVYITTNYTTNAFITFLNVTTNYTTNAFITFLTVNTNYTTNAWITYLTVNTNFTDVSFTTNLYVTTNYTTNAYITFLTVNSNAYFLSTNFINYSLTTNLYVFSNAYFFETNFVNYEITTNFQVISNAYFFETNYVNWEITTNLTIISNATVRGNLTINNIRITNAIMFATNRWDGPTNPINMQVSDQYYDTFTPVSVTGISNLIAANSHNIELSISNASTTNINVYIAAGIRSPSNDPPPWVIGPADVMITRFKHGTFGTNAIGRNFH